jgi:hypothetical protein
MDPYSIDHAITIAGIGVALVSALLACGVIVWGKAKLFSALWCGLVIAGFVLTMLGYIAAVHVLVNWGNPNHDMSLIWADPSLRQKVVPLVGLLVGAVVGGVLASRSVTPPGE